MNVTCPSCQSRYSVDDSRVPPAGVTIRCPKCNDTFSVKPDADAVALPGRAAAPPPPPTASAPAGGDTDSVALPGTAPRGPSAAPRPATAPPPSAAAVPLPGAQPSPAPPPRAPPASPPPSRDDPVPLPSGSGASPVIPPPRNTTADVGMDSDGDSLDLGLDDTPPPPRSAPQAEPDDLPGLPGAGPKSPSSARGGAAPPDDLPGLPVARSATPADLPGLPRDVSSSGLELEDPLAFIDQHASEARPAAAPRAELRVRKRGGQVLGPFGLDRIEALLRSGDLTGNEDISTDGASWRAMTSHRELNEAINRLHEADPMSFGQVDLPMPAEADLPGLRGSPAASRAQSSDGLGDLSLDTGALPPVEDPLDALVGDVERSSQNAPVAAPLHVAPPPGGGPNPYGDDELGAYADADPANVGSTPTGSVDALEVGEIPDLPPIWQTYRKPILAFVGVAAVVLVGVFTHLFTPWGAFGIPGAVEWALSEPPPPAPRAPPPPPPRVANPEELAALFEEGTYEAYRSILATVEAAGATLPDNRVAAAKAQAFGALELGPDAFPLAPARAAVDALEGIDLTATRFETEARAQLEVLLARAAMGLADGNGPAFVEPLSEATSTHPERADLWWLLGLALSAAGRAEDAVAAQRRALELEPKHARAHAALGRMEIATDPGASAEHYARAIEARPELATLALEAAEAFEKAEMFGSARRARRTAARAAERGLPPDRRAPLLLDVVTAYDALGRIDEVLPLAREAGRLRPADAEYVAVGALADVAAGDADAAVATLDALLQREPTSVPGLVARARARFAQQDVAKAFLDLEAARAAAPRDPEVPLWEGRFNLQLGKTSDAEAALLRAIKLSATDPTPTVELGRAKLEAGDVESALIRAEAAVKLSPNDPRAHVLAGEVYVRRGQIEEALAAFRRAAALDRHDLDAKLGEANMLRERAELQPAPAESEDLAKARELYTEALEGAPENPRVLFEYGRALELVGEDARALELYEQAAATDRSDPRPHLSMTAAFLERDPPNVERARRSLDVAREIERETGKPSTEVRFWEARVALREGEVRDAISSMRQAVEKEPRNAIYQYWLGRALEKNGSLYEAIASYEQAVTLNSRFAAAQRALGWTELERHRFSEARKWFARYRETAPHDVSIWVDIGESWVRQNRDDKALAAFEKALAANEEDARALLHVGNILSRKGQERAALQRFEQIVARDPDHGEAWCLIGLSRSRRRVTREARAALDRCLELESAPADLREMAQNILDTPSR